MCRHKKCHPISPSIHDTEPQHTKGLSLLVGDLYAPWPFIGLTELNATEGGPAWRFEGKFHRLVQTVSKEPVIVYDGLFWHWVIGGETRHPAEVCGEGNSAALWGILLNLLTHTSLNQVQLFLSQYPTIRGDAGEYEDKNEGNYSCVYPPEPSPEHEWPPDNILSMVFLSLVKVNEEIEKRSEFS